LSELRQVIPQYTKDQVQHLVRELKVDGKIDSIGRGAFAKWYYKETE